MACYNHDNPSNSVKVARTESLDSFTDYVIEVRIGGSVWFVRHRYSEFFELNERLVQDYKVDRKLLPPKKVFGNTTDAFIQKRRTGLENYLQSVMEQYQQIPFPLAMFLDFQKYVSIPHREFVIDNKLAQLLDEINGVTQILAETLFTRGEMLLENSSTCSMDPLQLHAITDRLMSPGGIDVVDSSRDMGHILDFVTRLEKLKVIGSDKYIETSNINMNQLEFSLSMFKNLKYLELVKCNMSKIQGINTLRPQLQKLRLKKCIQVPKDFLMLNLVYWEDDTSAGPSNAKIIWPCLTWVDLSENHITELDDSMRCLEKMEYLDLHDNYLESVDNLESISYLSHLDLSNNRFKQLNALHLKLGNVKSINLSGNCLDTLHAFNKLYSLEYLDVSNNQISQVLELQYLGSLPLLETLILVGNPVTVIPDYRVQVLKIFGDRAKEIHLDNKLADEKELDTIAVLLALDHSKKPRKAGSSWPLTKKSSEHSASTSSNVAAASRVPAEEDLTSCGTPPGRAAQAGGHWLTMLDSSPDGTSQQYTNEPAAPRPRFDSPFSSPDRSNSVSEASFHSVSDAGTEDENGNGNTRRSLLPEEPVVNNDLEQSLDQTASTEKYQTSGDSSPQTVHSIESDDGSQDRTSSGEHQEDMEQSERREETHVTAQSGISDLNISSNNCVEETSTLTNGSSVITKSTPHLSLDLMDHLGQCLSHCSLDHSDLGSLVRFYGMDGEELLNYFYDANELPREGSKDEELCHAMWTQLLQPGLVLEPVPALVLLSNRATYFLREKDKDSLDHNYLCHDQLKTVWIGTGSQSISFEDTSPQSVFCCLTRNAPMINDFATRLTFILDTDFAQSDSSNDEERSIYDPISTRQPSHVKFNNQEEVNIRAMLSLISDGNDRENQQEFVACAIVDLVEQEKKTPITVTLTRNRLVLLKEDYTFCGADISIENREQFFVISNHNLQQITTTTPDLTTRILKIVITPEDNSDEMLEITFPDGETLQHFNMKIQSLML